MNPISWVKNCSTEKTFTVNDTQITFKEARAGTILGRTAVVTLLAVGALALTAAVVFGGLHLGHYHTWAHVAHWLGKSSHLKALILGGGFGLLVVNLVALGVIKKKISDSNALNEKKLKSSLAYGEVKVEGDTETKTMPKATFKCSTVSKPAEYREMSGISTEEFENVRAAVADAQGTRPSMEDAHFATTITISGQEVRLYGVCDGHGGARASKYVTEQFRQRLEEKVPKASSVGSAITRVCHDLNSAVVEKFKGDGTTLTGALVFDKAIMVFNNGDSRSILVRADGTTQQLTKDHSPGNEEVDQKLESMGYLVATNRYQTEEGIVEVKRVGKELGIYALASHIGGHAVDDLPCWTDVTMYHSGSDYAKGDTLIMACDGLYDVGTTQEVGAAVTAAKTKELSNAQISTMLVDAALVSGSGDNVTVMVITL